MHLASWLPAAVEDLEIAERAKKRTARILPFPSPAPSTQLGLELAEDQIDRVLDAPRIPIPPTYDPHGYLVREPSLYDVPLGLTGYALHRHIAAGSVRDLNSEFRSMVLSERTYSAHRISSLQKE